MTGGFSGGTEAENVKGVRRVRKSDREVAEPCLPGLAVQRLDGLFFSIFPDQAAAVRIANTAEHFHRICFMSRCRVWATMTACQEASLPKR
jgi:hypothetical protein